VAFAGPVGGNERSLLFPVEFQVFQKDTASQARCGELALAHGRVPTPVFMPVGTQATVKTVPTWELEELEVSMILANAYHLALRPGDDVVREMGGLHSFMSWERPILTDSGGFQVFSLPDLRKVTEGGVRFRSHIDGTEIFLTPERCIEIQANLGPDVIMQLDECAPFPAERDVVAEAMRRTVGWAARCKAAHRRPDQALFGVVQGGTFADLRRECADRLCALDLDGYAVGGLSVGEGPVLMREALENTAPRLPESKPRYLMGVGLPEDIVEAVARGVDMFDCVLPTRCGRSGLAFTSTGRVKIKKSAHRLSDRPLDENCDCPACTRFSRAYLRHLFHTGEVLGLHLLSVHNIRYYTRLMFQAREAIKTGTFGAFRRSVAAIPVEET